MAETVEERKARMARVRESIGNKKKAQEQPTPAAVAEPEAPAPAQSEPTQAETLVEEQLRDVAEAGGVEPVQGQPETIPPNLFSGFTKRLEYFGEREGYRRRWFNDDKGGTNIGSALKSGWKMVPRTDVQLNAAVTPRNNDLGSHIRQYVGINEAGQPMYAYLMEKPQWLCDQHDLGPGSREEYHKKLEAQIMGGTLGEKAGERRYSQANPFPGSPGSLPPIQVDTKINR